MLSACGDRRLGEVAHPDLQHHDREPARPDQPVEREARPDPGLAKRIAAEMNESKPGKRLGDCRGRGEHIVGDNDGAQRRGDGGRLLFPLGAKEEEGDAEPGAEQDRGADQMQELDGEIKGHRFSWKAITTQVAAIIGATFSSGPKWSAHSSGAIALRPMR